MSEDSDQLKLPNASVQPRPAKRGRRLRRFAREALHKFFRLRENAVAAWGL
jgi:hypothetical protein